MTSKAIEISERPHKGSLEEARLWLSMRSRSQLALYKSSDPDAFRMVGPRVGPMERLVKTLVPVTKLGSVLYVSECQGPIKVKSCC